MLAQYGGPEDITAMTHYLRTKPAGASITEARSALGATAVDSRKLAALEQWGFIELADGRLVLRERGREVARDAATLQRELEAVCRDQRAYREALEKAYFQNLAELDQHELGAFWHENFAVELGSSAEQSIARACSAFLRIAAAAGLGDYTLGRRGAPTRLRVDRDALTRFIEGVDSTSSTGDPAPLEADVDTGTDSEVSYLPPAAPAGVDPLRVFISHGKNMGLVEQVTTVLGLANVPFEIAVEEESTAIPVPEKVLGSMRRCSAGIVIVSVDNEQDSNPVVNDNVLIEIGAAFVLYDKQVVLVWDKRLPVPSNLQGLYRCEFEGAELGWASGMKLMKTIGAFRQQSAA